MFGYITFYKDELKIKDFNIFKAYYCGLCKELGKRYNQAVRLGLSYDFTFLALLLDSADKAETCFKSEGCFKHLGKRRAVVGENNYIKYAADMSVALMYYKMLDDVKDSFSLLSAVALIPYWFCARKVRRIYPDKMSVIKQSLNELSALEKNKCKNIDEVSNAFAKLMEALFDCGTDQFKGLGYNIGRFIYIADAADDYEKDLKSGCYNPFKYAYPNFSIDEVKAAAERSMTITLAMASQCYEQIDIIKNKELLDNIIYLGLRQRMDMIVKKGNKDGKSI